MWVQLNIVKRRHWKAFYFLWSGAILKRLVPPGLVCMVTCGKSTNPWNFFCSWPPKSKIRHEFGANKLSKKYFWQMKWQWVLFFSFQTKSRETSLQKFLWNWRLRNSRDCLILDTTLLSSGIRNTLEFGFLQDLTKHRFLGMVTWKVKVDILKIINFMRFFFSTQ